MNSPLRIAPPQISAFTLRAHFDGQHIVLDEPSDLPTDTPLVVLAVQQNDLALDAERREWVAFSLKNLARAYGPNEPEYDASMCKELNPDYQER